MYDMLPESEKQYGLFTEESYMVGIQQKLSHKGKSQLEEVFLPKEKSVCRGESYLVAFRYH